MISKLKWFYIVVAVIFLCSGASTAVAQQQSVFTSNCAGCEFQNPPTDENVMELDARLGLVWQSGIPFGTPTLIQICNGSICRAYQRLQNGEWVQVSEFPDPGTIPTNQPLPSAGGTSGGTSGGYSGGTGVGGCVGSCGSGPGSAYLPTVIVGPVTTAPP